MFNPFHFGKSFSQGRNYKWVVTVAAASLLSAITGASIIYLFINGVDQQIPHPAISQILSPAPPFTVDDNPVSQSPQGEEVEPPAIPWQVARLVPPFGDQADVAGLPAGEIAQMNMQSLSENGSVGDKQAVPGATISGSVNDNDGETSVSARSGELSSKDAGNGHDGGRHAQSLSHGLSSDTSNSKSKKDDHDDRSRCESKHGAGSKGAARGHSRN